MPLHSLIRMWWFVIFAAVVERKYIKNIPHKNCDSTKPTGWLFCHMGKIETNDHILDCAIDLFWQKSYHGVNMNELSRVAKVNKATLYQYFLSKEEIAVAALARAMKRAQEQVYQASFDETTNPRQRLEGIYQKAYAMHLALYETEGKCRGCPFVNLGVELSTSSDAIRQAV